MTIPCITLIFIDVQIKYFYFLKWFDNDDGFLFPTLIKLSVGIAFHLTYIFECEQKIPIIKSNLTKIAKVKKIVALNTEFNGLFELSDVSMHFVSIIL